MINELMKYDNTFDEASFKSYVENVFVKLFTALMIDDMDSVKHFLSDDVYNFYCSKVSELNRRGVIQMYDELNVRDSQIENVNITEDKFIVSVRLSARYLDYLLDKETSSFVSGDNNTRVSKDYMLTFEKTRKFLQQGAVRKCPGCGASISVNTSGKCSYCGTIYNLDKYDYILVNIVSL